MVSLDDLFFVSRVWLCVGFVIGAFMGFCVAKLIESVRRDRTGKTHG